MMNGRATQMCSCAYFFARALKIVGKGGTRADCRCETGNEMPISHGERSNEH